MKKKLIIPALLILTLTPTTQIYATPVAEYALFNKNKTVKIRAKVVNKRNYRGLDKSITYYIDVTHNGKSETFECKKSQYSKIKIGTTYNFTVEAESEIPGVLKRQIKKY